MNEDQDFNEDLASEATQKEAIGPNDIPAEGSVTNDNVDEEELGKAVIDAASTIKKPKNNKSKKTVDDTQNAQIAELVSDLQRTRADFENFRRQVEVQKEQYGNAVKFATVKKMLPLLDDFERAIAANPDTLGPLEKSLAKSVKELGLSKIPAEVGAVFNPDLHDAVMVEGEGEEELIGETLRPGYYFDEIVIRPAMVKVKKQ